MGHNSKSQLIFFFSKRSNGNEISRGLDTNKKWKKYGQLMCVTETWNSKKAPGVFVFYIVSCVCARLRFVIFKFLIANDEDRRRSHVHVDGTLVCSIKCFNFFSFGSNWMRPRVCGCFFSSSSFFLKMCAIEAPCLVIRAFLSSCSENAVSNFII